MPNIYEQDLDKNPANHQQLTPLTFLGRSAAVFPEKIAVVHEDLQYTYREFYARCRKLASSLEKAGYGLGDEGNQGTIAALKSVNTVRGLS